MFALIKSTPAKDWRIALSIASFWIWAAPASGGPLIREVPEPASLLLLAVGLVVLWWGLKKRKP